MTLTRLQLVGYGIIGVLAIIIVGVLVFYQVVSAPVGEWVEALGSPTVSVGGLQASTAAKPFDTSVLRDPRYLELDTSLIEQGRLPVQPPVARGKPNLF